MATIVTRAGKGSPLTNTEVDANFTNLNADKLESSSYTASDVLTKIKTVDGTGSGLDADLLDGNQATAFATAAQGSLADSAVQNLGDLGITSTSSELNTLDGFTGTKDDLNYAKDLRATGVTSTEYDYLDGVTSNIQTQLDNKLADSNPILDAISETIADTAVDVFVYDTRKDSDGGAWRKRCQHTSWYNETLNTATRGSRKEFPAVAVIVLESSATTDYPQFTIYDGDDPDMPMWMVFNVATGGGGADQTITNTYYAAGPYTASAIFAKNGVIVDCQYRSAGHIGGIVKGVTEYKMIEDASYMTTDEGHFKRNGNLGSTRNTVSTYTYISNKAIVHTQCNDVAMTVLPNAPIDAATGLPVPTIAVATDGGVSVIKDDGSVASSAGDAARSVEYLDNNYLIITRNNDSGYFAVWNNYFTSGTWNSSSYSYVGSSVPPFKVSGYINGIAASENGYFGNSIGIHIYDDLSSKATNADGLFSNITSSYNTGWMNGDIKLATLSDTDDTDVTGSELVTNGTFDTDTSGWTAYNSSTLSIDTNRLKAVNATTASGATQAISTIVGKIYTVSARLVQGTAYPVFNVGTTIGTSNLGQIYLGVADGYGSITFTATTTTTYLYARVNSDASGAYAYWDNISVRLAEPDRSVNGNGLQVFGTVTKTPVNSGADLVAYSGFSSSNYLEQPYNSDLDFGTGDFCIMGWIKEPANSVGETVFVRSNTSGEYISIYIVTDGRLQAVAYSTNNTIVYSSNALDDSVWHHICVVRTSGGIAIYIDGKFNNTTSISGDGDFTNVGATTKFGYQSGSSALTGSLALWRISATAPSAEQIAKIYEDEKVLFQENAKAVLYGASDAVTALAYDDDTNLLHVGTSAGRSVFQGLRRVDNTTSAVGAAISASNGLVAED
jgi:hypothetical protein